jgi:hypothetical protein
MAGPSVSCAAATCTRCRAKHVGELHDEQGVDMHMGTFGNVGNSGNPRNSGNRGNPGNRGNHGCPYRDVFGELLAGH